MIPVLDVAILAKETVAVDTEGIVSFLVKYILPIIAGVVGTAIAATANKGKTSEAANKATVLVIGAAVISGGVLLHLVGDFLVDTAFNTNVAVSDGKGPK